MACNKGEELLEVIPRDFDAVLGEHLVYLVRIKRSGAIFVELFEYRLDLAVLHQVRRRELVLVLRIRTVAFLDPFDGGREVENARGERLVIVLR